MSSRNGRWEWSPIRPFQKSSEVALAARTRSRAEVHSEGTRSTESRKKSGRGEPVNIERGPRKERGFVIIDNTLAQDSALSFGARGLGTYLLSLPPGSQVDIRSLAAANPEGRDAISRYMHELEAAFYLVRTTAKKPNGQFATTCTMHEDRQDPATLPPSAAKPWSKAKKSDRPRLSSVAGPSGEAEFSQVGPNPGKPAFGQPTFGEPAPGRPDAGETGDNPYGVKEPGERTSSSPAGPVENQGGGGGDAAQQQEDPRAADFIDSLPYRGRIPGPKARSHLIARATEALNSGWSEYRLRKQLTSDTETAKSMAAVFRYRLEPENLPPAPEPDDAPVPAQRAVPLRPSCPECERPLAFGSEPVLCRDCRADATA